MISSPESNVVLDAEDTRKIELVTNRLTTLQKEVLNATKQVATLEEQIATLDKAQSYALEQKLTVEAQVQSLLKQKEDVTLAIANSNMELENHRSERLTHTTAHTKKQVELDTRHANLAESERLFSEKMQALVLREKQLEIDRAQVDNARSVFLEAISAVIWK